MDGLARPASIDPDMRARCLTDLDDLESQSVFILREAFRKVEPLERALEGFAATISGRKRYQGGARSGLRAVEVVGGRIQVNPLASFTRERVAREFAVRGLPPHPLEADGFLSIGCMPCTDRVGPAEDRRAGRWRGRDKDECGIHVAPRRSAGERA